MKAHYSCVYDIKFVLVLDTHESLNCINAQIGDFLKSQAKSLCAKADINLIGFSFTTSTVTLTLDAHPSFTPVKFINSLKTVSSRSVRKNFTEHLAGFYDHPVFWARGYSLFSTSSSYGAT